MGQEFHRPITPDTNRIKQTTTDMKKLVLTSLALTCAASVFAQGTVVLNTRLAGTTVSKVYSPKAGDPSFKQIGNSAADTPVGATDWAGFDAISGANYRAVLLSAPGLDVAASSLLPNAMFVTFRTGTAAGQIPQTTYVLDNVPAGPGGATLQLFAWDNTSGNFATGAAAWTAWQSGAIAAGVSGKFNMTASIGGGTFTPPTVVGIESFNLYMVPEPTSMALLGLGAAALMIFRRRQ